MRECLRILRALSGETRLKLVRLLSREEICVCELEYILGLTQPAISQQVRILRDAGLATARREGNWMFYRIDPKDLEKALDRVKMFFLSSTDQPDADDAMEDEWRRFQEILSEPLDNCPRVSKRDGDHSQ